MPFLGNIGPGELIILLVIILVIFGPGRLPEIGNAVGKGIREFRKAASDVTDATQIAPPAAPAQAASPTAAPAAPIASATAPSIAAAAPSATAPSSTAAAPGSSSQGDDEADARRRYEELKARFEPAAADQSHGDAGQPSA